MATKYQTNMTSSDEQFVSEPITPIAESMDFRPALSGAPAIPNQFTWRGQTYTIARIISQWKEDGPCKSSAKEQYLRKHWLHIQTTDNHEMKIYFERQARTKSQSKKRWWLYTIK